MTGSIPTSGQLERTLSQRILALYRTQTGHRLERVSSQIVDRKVVIVLENSVTQPAQFLLGNGKEELAEEVHLNLNEAIQPQIRKLIEEVVGVAVIDLLSDAKLDTERTGFIALLAETPQLNTRSTASKVSSEARKVS
ncbi:DUF2294 domain-containing protein [Pantanalinema rosaneae CENA516]|uniref:DUF2294 domain-containing protein n=1 Tax=Pantanalinema rosaneae TaxID=1620701 RepID=UPI003D6DDD0B